MDEEKLEKSDTQNSDNSTTKVKSQKALEIKNKISGVSKKKKIIAIIIIIVLIIVCFKGCSTNKNKNEGISTYAYSTATRTSITEYLSGNGTLEPADKYTVTTLLKGDVLQDTFEVGDKVSENDVLYQIDSSEMKTNIERAELSATSVKRNYTTAVENVENLNVKSKVGGTVVDILVEVGDDVSAGQEVAKVRDDSIMTLELTFPADEAEKFYIGQAAEVTLYGSFETLQGKVTSVSGATQVLDGNMIVRNVEISVENPGAISETQIATAEVGTSGSTQSGKFKFKENRSILAEASGEVVQIVNDEGSNVSKGSTIIRLENESLLHAVEDASNSIRDSELNIDNLRENLEDYTVKSPINGTIIEKNVKSGDTIDSGAKLCTVYDLSYLKMTMNVDELDIRKISIGQEATITADALPGETFVGKVISVNLAGTTNNGVTTYPVGIQIDEPGNLLPGMNVSAEILVSNAENVIAVPTSAVVRGDLVLVKTGNNSDDETIPKGYEYVSVETGLSDGFFVEIKSGINENDEIAYMDGVSSFPSGGSEMPETSVAVAVG